MTVTDRTGATDQEFAARIAAFDGEAAPESYRRLPGEVELHRAMNATPEQMDRLRETAAALAPQPAENLADRLRDVAADLDYYASKTTGGSTADGYTEAAQRIRDALAGVDE